MLTVQINDAQLEQRLLDEARTTGKTTQEVVEELLTALLPTLNYPHLDPHKHGYVLDNPSASGGEQMGDVALFSQVDDAADFVSEQRKIAWRRP